MRHFLVLFEVLGFTGLKMTIQDDRLLRNCDVVLRINDSVCGKFPLLSIFVVLKTLKGKLVPNRELFGN